MNEVYLVINGRKFPVHYLHLLAIAAHLPDGTHCRELARALLALGVPSIAMVLIASSGALLTQEDMDALWAGGDPNIRRSLAAKPEFVEQLTDAQARDILAADNREVLKFLARRADLLFSDPAGRQGRLSPAMADALLEHIAGSPYPELRQILAEGRNMPSRFRPTFRECVESGFNAKKNWSTIRTEDLELLDTVSMETLRRIADHVEDIEEEGARRGVIHLLCSHPDPSVRLALARNPEAPRSALGRLARDTEPDVSLTAQETLRAPGVCAVGDEPVNDEED